MASSSILSVYILDAQGKWQPSRHFNTARAARKWAKWLAAQPYVREVVIYRGAQ